VPIVLGLEKNPIKFSKVNLPSPFVNAYEIITTSGAATKQIRNSA
jgi:hypothetical protein